MAKTKKDENKYTKLLDKLKPKKKLNEKEKKVMVVAFNVLAIFCIVMYSISITPKTLQNDTYYTVKIGQQIREYGGLDYRDNYSWHDLEYLYPHWLYDVATSLIYDFANGFWGVYIATCILCAILGIVVYLTNKKMCKNEVVSFVATMAQMYLLKDYVAARAQLATFILFVLTVLCIERFLEKPKPVRAVPLIIIPILIANIHSAVFPFYFVLYLPYIAEYLIRIVLDLHLPHKIYQFLWDTDIKNTNKKLKKANKENATKYQQKLAMLNKGIEKSNTEFEKFVTKQNSLRKNPYKIKTEKIDAVKWLILIMAIALFTGLLTPLRDMPYTYTARIMMGNTTKSISEHLALTLIENKGILVFLSLSISLLIFTKVKIKLRDLFFLAGLTLLSFMTRRQTSMLALFGGFALARVVTDILIYYDKKGLNSLLKFMASITGEVLTIILIFSMCYTEFKPKISADFIAQDAYPVKAVEWIKGNLDYKNIKIFNDYNYGSYLLFEDIPVFIDSRCDLYTPEFNGKYNNEKKKFEGKDIFSDCLNISSIGTFYENKFKEYGVTHLVLKTKSKLNMLIARDKNYTELYRDDNFVVYDRKVE